MDETKKPFKREDYPGEHLTPLYDELYDACWNGDNDKIRALCLPPGDDPTAIPSGTRDLLQITVRVTYTEHTTYHSKGYTPLHVALRSRKWDTARLILEIAEEQYTEQEDEEELEPFGSSLVQRPGIQSQTENQPVDKTDDAAGVHAVSVNVKPNELLSYQAKCAIGSGSASAYIPDAGPLTLFIRENDLEAFTQIADMVATLKEPTPIESHLYDILRIDSAAMLDAYIRRTGAGLLLPEQSPTDGTTQLRHHDYYSRGRYLGLNVRGKKRRDHGSYEWSRAFYQLETQAPVGLNVQGMRQWNHEPDPWFLPFSGPRGEVGLAWQAASSQAIEVLDYLNSPNAIQAFKYYAENNTTDLATRIAKALQNTDDFPKMAGFFVNSLAETPVLATFWNTAKPDRILPTLKKLMELHPKLTADGIRLRVKPNRMSALFLLCTAKAPVEAFDWMLANGADPLLRDERGYDLVLCLKKRARTDLSRRWNILHVLFSRNDLHWPLIEHAVTKLPITTIETLMAHQSRIRRNTPFSIAVKMSNLKLVDLLLRTVKSAVLPALLLRDSTGATPLHSAVLSGYSKIVSLVVAAGPPEILSVENGVGSTPAEITRLQLLNTTLRGLANPLVHPTGLYIQGPDGLNLTPAPGMRDCDVEEVKSLRRVIDGIKASGTLAQKPELLEVLSNFADDSEQASAIWEAQKPKDTAQLPDYDVEDVKATFDVLSEAFTEVDKRQAVHLHDIQLAVHTAIEAPAGTGPMSMFRLGHLGEEDPDLKQDSNWSAIIGYPLTDHEIEAEKTTHRGVTVF
ncbi:hypothetical protein FRC01_008504 [Tulasnella sp. 417]|nr:hypothetical protein FRC01_008504 [Tulasnella sp. 417]